MKRYFKKLSKSEILILKGIYDYITCFPSTHLLLNNNKVKIYEKCIKSFTFMLKYINSSFSFYNVYSKSEHHSSQILLQMCVEICNEYDENCILTLFKHKYIDVHIRNRFNNGIFYYLTFSKNIRLISHLLDNYNFDKDLILFDVNNAMDEISQDINIMRSNKAIFDAIIKLIL